MTAPVGPPAAQPERPPGIDAPSRTLTPARLSTGVIIILLITMFSACSAANDAREAANNARDAANNSANQSVIDPSGPAGAAEVLAMCRLLGAVAAKQGTDVAAVFQADQTGTQCQQVATESGAPQP